MMEMESSLPSQSQRKKSSRWLLRVGVACALLLVVTVGVARVPGRPRAVLPFFFKKEASLRGNAPKEALRGSAFPQPAVRRSRGGTLRTRLVVGVRTTNGVVGRSYEDSAPGPTLRLKPGDVLSITVVNGLTGDAPGEENTLRRPNTTSLHVHGLHVSPSEDDVFTAVSPGSSKEYLYHIPSDHPAGTYWYHAHYHGSSMLQVSGGMLGALIIEYEHEEDVVMVLQQTNLASGKARNYAYASAASGSLLPVTEGTAAPGPGDTVGDFASQLPLKAPLNGSFFTVNGATSPVLLLPEEAAEWVRLRLVNAATNDFVVAKLSSCEAWTVARDGFNLAEPRRSLTETAPLILPPGSRADVAVRCAEDAVLYSDAHDPNVTEFLGAKTDVHDGVLLKLKQRSRRRLSAFPGLPQPSERLYASLLEAPVDHRGVFEWYVGGSKAAPRGASYTVYGVNDEPYSSTSSLTVELGKVHEWVVTSAANDATSGHPFHLHTNHFQIVAVSQGAGLDYAVGDWRDTISVPAPGNVTIRFRPLDYTGHSLAHCHIFSHVDLGMAADVFIVEPIDQH